MRLVPAGHLCPPYRKRLLNREGALMIARQAEPAGKPEWISVHDRPHVLIGRHQGRHVIGKRPDPSVFGSPLRWRTLRKRADFRREIAVYRAGTRQFDELKLPALVTTDEHTYFCVEKIEHNTEDVPAAPEIKARAAASLAEFQTRLQLDETLWQRSVLAITRSPLLGLVRRSLGAVRRSFGSGVALRCVSLAVRQSMRQRPLARRYTLHGDFSRRNTLWSEDGTVYLIDFGDTFYSRRWPLWDILYYVTTDFHGEQDIDLNPIRRYLQAVSELDGGLAIRGMNLQAQVRLGLLRRMLWRLASSRGRSHSGNATFLTDVLLRDDAFEAWYRRTFGELEIETGRLVQAGGP
jgi:hypothetical protein